MYDFGFSVTKDDKQALRWYGKAAKQGYVDAQRWLGVMYRNGEGVTTDHKEAGRWFRLPAIRATSRRRTGSG